MADISALRLEKLDGLMHGVTPALAAKLASAVELDRLRGGALPHDKILEALRPRLREAERQLERMPSPRRMVSTVFEDLLLARPRLRKQKGRIARSSLRPIWEWLTQTLLSETAAPILGSIHAKLLDGAIDFAHAEISQFHALAGPAVLAAIPGGDPLGAGAADALRALGDADVVMDAYDMARMMEIAPLVTRLQQGLARPIRALSEDDIKVIREVWDQAVVQHPDGAPYIVFVVLGRLEKPWEALRLAGALSRKMDDRLVSKTDAGAVGEILLTDLEDCVEHLAKMRPSEVRAAEALVHVGAFSNLSTGIVRELGIRRDGAWGRRLMAARAGIADQMERLLTRAIRDIAATLPMTRKGHFSLKSRKVPDLTRTFDSARAANAVRYAELVSGSRPYAAAGAFGSIIARIDDKIGALIRQYTTDLIDELAGLTAEQRRRAEPFADHAVALTGLFFSETDADIIRRRAAAATVSQSAPEAA